ncbi:MAG: RluA family pseudouridine synthase [Oscillospiraceae bacterium]|nr:RluA family pseudouridine synthase [Oscillospiraceae bacterium]
MILSYTVKESDRGRTVFSILRNELHISAALTRRMKAANAISVCGVPVYTNYIVNPGETVAANINSAEPPCDNLPEEGELEILFENDGLIAVNKPAGLIVHPSRAKNTGTLSNFVAGFLLKSGNNPSCHAVNRLDRDTTGVTLFAKNSHMKARAAAALNDKSTVKEYAALVYGRFPSQGVIDLPVRRVADSNMLRAVLPDGQRAVTHFNTLRVFTGNTTFSLVQFRLETGRTHQIRVHCLHLGHPVLGDTLYNTEPSRAVSRALGVASQALHAYKLKFTEPLTGELLELTAPYPEAFGNLLENP